MPASNSSSRSLAELVDLRANLLRAAGRHPSWAAVEARVADSLRAHFAADPPQLRRIDARTPISILRQIVRYEAVHKMQDLGDLWRRLQSDRRCYALFSPSMPNEPLVFTELAFTRGIAEDVSNILNRDAPVVDPEACDSAMFYSISSCHEGLRGVPFGNLLIRRVVERLRQEMPFLQTFATVSPVPGFRPWLKNMARDRGGRLNEIVTTLDHGRWMDERYESARLKAALLPLCASYLLDAKRGTEPLDPVARFHLGNGASIEGINWLGDRSADGFTRSAGITANYLYNLADVDVNHDFYRRTHAVIAARRIEILAHGATVSAS